MSYVGEKKYEYSDLIELSVGDLKKIRHEKFDTMFEVRKEKEKLISNILSTQSLIEKEIEENKKK